MASPSSSATTPSPALDHIIPGPPSDVTSNPDIDMESVNDKEARQSAVEKFLARAELSKLTRALRARLSYASYKAVNNVSHVPLPTLETQIQPRTSFYASHTNASGNQSTLLGSLTSPTKRKASAVALNAISASYHNSGKPNANARSSQSDGLPNGPVKRSSISSAVNTSGPSLFQSILAPPAAKRARTIHNPEASPIMPGPPPSAPKKGGPTVKKTKGKADNEKVPGNLKAKPKANGNANKKEMSSPRSRGRANRNRSNSQSTTATRASLGSLDGEENELKAAETLTQLLMKHASSGPGLGVLGSPTSSSRPNEAGSSFSQQFMQSSTRTNVDGPTGPPDPMPRSPLRASFTSGSPRLAVPGAVAALEQNRSTTPANVPVLSLTSPSSTLRSPRSPMRSHSRAQSQGEPQPLPMSQSSATSAASTAVSVEEAADWMLHLHNSPSPRRANRTEVNPNLVKSVYAAGRVLFPSGSSQANSSSAATSFVGSGSGTTLTRGGSQFSSFSSVGSVDRSERTVDEKGEGGSTLKNRDAKQQIPGDIHTAAIAPTNLFSTSGSHTTAGPLPSRIVQTPSQLLPPPPLPSRAALTHESARVSMRTPPNATTSSTLPFSLVQQSPTPTAQHARRQMQLQSPAPSPTRGSVSSSSHLQIHGGPPTAPATPSSSFNLGDYIHDVSPAPAALSFSRHAGVHVGRRLFEEQASHMHSQVVSKTGHVLGSGIDLVKT